MAMLLGDNHRQSFFLLFNELSSLREQFKQVDTCVRYSLEELSLNLTVLAQTDTNS